MFFFVFFEAGYHFFRGQNDRFMQFPGDVWLGEIFLSGVLRGSFLAMTESGGLFIIAHKGIDDHVSEPDKDCAPERRKESGNMNTE